MRVRFAPSPTGFLHIGGARTALFNWMYARSQNGKFILRIEDTDLERSKKEYLDEILDSMQWLGLQWDELYKQSDRFPIYREYAQKLLGEDKAYKDGEAIILKMSAPPIVPPLSERRGETSPPADLDANKAADGGPLQIIKWFDLIRGEITFDASEIKDQVLMKSDGSPTYSFACVVDDALMEISCVIRGEDHISNTPKQLALYHSLGFKPPKFAHLPLIMGEEGGRMSKRHGATAVTEYRKMGFLPEAVVNYLMLLGWSPGNNQEIVKMATALKNFSIKKINKAGAAFSMEKLEWINSQYIKQTDTAALVALLRPLLAQRGWADENFDSAKLENIVNLFKARMTTLQDFFYWGEFLFVDPITIDSEARVQYLSQDRAKEFKLLGERLREIPEFNAASAESVFRELVAKLGIASSELVHPVRVALTGKSVGPGLFETMAVLGKDRTVKRLSETVFHG